MKHILIAVAEYHVVKRLKRLLFKFIDVPIIIDQTDTIQDTVHSLLSKRDYDFIFIDTQLADGPGIEVFKLVSLSQPIIFLIYFEEKNSILTTSNNQTCYLQKPINTIDLLNLLS